MKLSKHVPARKKSIEVLRCIKEFMQFGKYKNIRKKGSMKFEKYCFWCKHIFDDNEMIGLATIKRSGNKLLCQNCVSKIHENANETTDREKAHLT